MKRLARITTKWERRGYVPFDIESVQAYSIDSAMDTDTDSWTLEVGDIGNVLKDVLKRDNEVRVQIFGLGGGGIETLHSGFCDEITVDQEKTYTFSGRDMSAVAVDSQHPPQIWHYVRPEKLVAREARFLQIGDRLRLSKERHFKKYVTDGSESYWDVWYRFYRKNGKWMWAEPDGTIIAGTLNYDQRPQYYFGRRPIKGKHPYSYIPVERVEIRSSKQGRVGEVYYFGHRGDTGFVAHEIDPATQSWIKKPTAIFTSNEVHGPGEARSEAQNEIFETMVGAIEIKLLIQDPGFIIRQNRMAFVNIPHLELSGEYFVVGTQLVGSVDQGFYQQVRLREPNYAISRRVPTSPQLQGTGGAKGGDTTIANNLSDATWPEAFVKAAQTYHGVWSLQLFLGALLSMCQQESGFRNVREGGSTLYPGTKDGKVPYMDFSRKRTAADENEFRKFSNNYANDPDNPLNPYHNRDNGDAGVGPMQLTTHGFKLAADRIGPGTVGDELAGGRWNPESNIMVAGAVLAGKLGAGWQVTAEGKIIKVKPSGLSLSPTEANFWAGVKAYNGTGAAADAYMKSIKAIYKATYEAQVAAALIAKDQDPAGKPPKNGSGMTSAELRKAVLESKSITFTRNSQRDDIRYGLIIDRLLEFLIAFTAAGFTVTITALKTDHDKFVNRSNRRSAHSYGKAVDMGNFSLSTKNTDTAMRWIGNYQVELGWSQLIGPNDNLCRPVGAYDAATLADHDDHIHVGWPL